MNAADYIIVGAGIVGAATAMRLVQSNPQAKVIILEAGDRPATHQTGRNSGVIHAGVYYAPGSLKATFCREGCEETLAFCAQNNIDHERCGKLLVATHEGEIDDMHSLFNRCQENGLSPTLLTAKAIRSLEPNIHAVAGFKVHQSGITDYSQVCGTMLDVAKNSGRCEMLYSTAVMEIIENGEGVRIEAKSADGSQIQISGAKLINCAGIYADELAVRQGLSPTVRLLPFRGEYYRLSKRFDGLTKHLIYPIPDPRMPFLGVHLTKMIGGYTTVGPNAVLTTGREAYNGISLSLKEWQHIFNFAGTWKLLWRYRDSVLSEALTSLSKKAYLKRVRQYCQAISGEDLLPYRAGIRAQAVTAQGELVHDFVFEQTSHSLHVLNAPSPAATSAIPIANAILNKLSV